MEPIRRTYHLVVWDSQICSQGFQLGLFKNFSTIAWVSEHRRKCLITRKEYRCLRITRYLSADSPNLLSKSGLKGQPSSHTAQVLKLFQEHGFAAGWPGMISLLTTLTNLSVCLEFKCFAHTDLWSSLSTRTPWGLFSYWLLFSALACWPSI